MYTQEQLHKLEKLRQEREQERIKNRNIQKQIKENNNNLGKPRPIFYTIKGKTISGYIICKNNNDTYNITTKYGIFNNVKQCNIRGRYVENLDHVVIPEELKLVSTHTLLEYLKIARLTVFKYSTQQIKAELKNRPHIATKNEKKIFKK